MFGRCCVTSWLIDRLPNRHHNAPILSSACLPPSIVRGITWLVALPDGSPALLLFGIIHAKIPDWWVPNIMFCFARDVWADVAYCRRPMIYPSRHRLLAGISCYLHCLLNIRLRVSFIIMLPTPNRRIVGGYSFLPWCNPLLLSATSSLIYAWRVRWMGLDGHRFGQYGCYVHYALSSLGF